MTNRLSMHAAQLIAVMVASSASSTVGAPAGRIRVSAIRIQDTCRESAVHPEAGTDLEKSLSREGSARAARTALRSGLARESAVDSGSTLASDGAVLSGTVSLPLHLPPGVRGRRAWFRPGEFVEAKVTLQQPDGSMRTAEAHLRWRDVWWTTGAKVRRARPTEDVLRDAVRKAVDAAVKRLRAEHPSRGRFDG